jgi:hypothetical protein
VGEERLVPVLARLRERRDANTSRVAASISEVTSTSTALLKAMSPSRT